jgi:hypothetical protein
MTIARPTLAVLVLLPAVPAFAGERSTLLEPGARLRLTLPCADALPSPGERSGSLCRIEGRVDDLDPDAITLTRGSSSTRHPLASVSRIEVSRGERSRWKAGAVAGFVVGAVGTYVALDRGDSTNPCDHSTNQDAMGQGACIALAAAGGVAGAGLGALVGRLFRSERWEDVPKDRWRVSLGLRPGIRFHVSVALAF